MRPHFEICGKRAARHDEEDVAVLGDEDQLRSRNYGRSDVAGVQLRKVQRIRSGVALSSVGMMVMTTVLVFIGRTFATIDGLRAAAPATPIVVFTGSFDDATMLALLDRGVAGFVPKSSTTAVLASAIDLVVAGGRYLPERLAGPSKAPPLRAAAQLLSRRQIEVVVVDLCRRFDHGASLLNHG